MKKLRKKETHKVKSIKNNETEVQVIEKKTLLENRRSLKQERTLKCTTSKVHIFKLNPVKIQKVQRLIVRNRKMIEKLLSLVLILLTESQEKTIKTHSEYPSKVN